MYESRTGGLKTVHKYVHNSRRHVEFEVSFVTLEIVICHLLGFFWSFQLHLTTFISCHGEHRGSIYE